MYTYTKTSLPFKKIQRVLFTLGAGYRKGNIADLNNDFIVSIDWLEIELEGKRRWVCDYKMTDGRLYCGYPIEAEKG